VADIGRHSYDCCGLTVGISVTGADARSGQLRVVAGSHRALIGVAVAALSVTVLALLFSPAALRWVSGGGQDPASAASSGPDTR